MNDELLSPVKAAPIAGCHQDTVRRAIEKGFLPAQLVGHTWVIRRNDLQKWIEAGKPNHRRKSTRKPRPEVEETEDKKDLSE